MRQAIALLRVSSEAQAGPERQGLPAQREVCQRIASAHGLQVVRWVELEGVSGAAVLAEPRFARVLADLRAGPARGPYPPVSPRFDRTWTQERSENCLCSLEFVRNRKEARGDEDATLQTHGIGG